jgi:hypothetical protein
VADGVSANRELVELGDVEELARHVGRLARAEAWDELVELRDLCRSALERGRQLWPVSALAEYRLALDAPARWAARMLVTGAGRFTPGPLPEVAASTHTWADLAPWVDVGTPEPAVAAHERVVRGEVVADDDGRVMPGVLELPLRLEAWEPAYSVAVYEPDRAEFPLPPLAGLADVRISATAAAPVVDDHEAVRALVDLAAAWTTESNGRAEAVAVRGTAVGAVAALGVGRSCRMVELAPDDALARMAWAAANGGAHGRRRGMAAGRFAAWWAAAALTGLLDDDDGGDAWPPPPGELGEAVGELRWYAWDPGAPDTGWTCRLAVEDPADGLAWAVTATDSRL